jgi:hypothetical protein
MGMALAAQELRVLNLLLAHRRFAAPIASAAGLRISHFSQDDHRLIFAAWEVACERDLTLVQTLQLARHALQAEQLWDDDTPIGSMGMRHSEATLVNLALARATPEEAEWILDGNELDGSDPLAREIARQVVCLVAAADALAGGAA